MGHKSRAPLVHMKIVGMYRCYIKECIEIAMDPQEHFAYQSVKHLKAIESQKLTAS